MAWCFGDGFDLYAAQADLLAGYWDSGTAIGNLTASPNGRFPGSQAISWVSSSGGNAWVKSSGVNDGVHHFNVAFFQTATVSGSNVGFYLQLSDGATNQCAVGFRQDGAILLQSGAVGGTTLATYTGAVTAVNTWYTFEIEVVIHNTAGSFAVRKNGNTSNDFSATSLNTRPVSSNNYANRLGIGQNSSVNLQRIDDLLWRSDAASVPWVGDIRCYTRMPASDASVQFTRSAGASNASCVDETQQNGATDYVFDANVGDADFYIVGTIASTPALVVAVTTRGFLQKSDAGAKGAAVQIKSGGTTVASAATLLSSSFGWLWRTDTLDPATGTAWTATGVNNAQIGPIVTS